MPKDLTIRLLGRPTVTEDSVLGFHKLARKYVVQGPRACKAGIVDATNPLFLDVGTADEEFTDHYLVNQRLETAQGSMEKAYLTREFADIRDTWSSESISESGDLKRMSRRYAVLRAEHARGYDATSWAAHPHNSSVNENDPWDYLPKVIKDTEPVSVSYEDNSPTTNLFANAADTPSGILTPKVSVGGTPVSLATILASISSTDSLSLRWLRATATVDSSNPGVDIWQVSWAAPVTDHWTSRAGGGGRSGSSYPNLVEFDHNGIKNHKFGAVSGGSGISVMRSYVSYVVGETAGDAWASYFSMGSLKPSVSMDFFMEYLDGGGTGFKQSMPNSVYMYDASAHIVFPTNPDTDNPTASGSNVDGIRVSKAVPMGYIFRYREDQTITVDVSFDPANSVTTVTEHRYDAEGDDVYEEQTSSTPGINHPYYQTKAITRAGGKVNWSHAIDRSTIDQYSQNSGSSVSPIFSHGKDRIWKVVLTFVS
tara:strand:+ start:5192 stop:6637 length:1446 start_codon:yes stop_codon:yes gene_type:complete